MLALPQHKPPAYIVKEMIKVIGLIRESAIIVEDIFSLPTLISLSGWLNRPDKRLGGWNSRNWK